MISSNLLSSINQSINKSIVFVDEKIDTASRNPNAVKKILQLSNKIYSAIDLYREGIIKSRKINIAAQSTIDIIIFYSTYKNVLFWINPFSKNSMDQKVLKDSLEISLNGVTHDKTQKKEIAERIFGAIMKSRSIYNTDDVVNIIGKELEKDVSKDKAHEIAKNIVIQNKSRGLPSIIAKAFFTLGDFGENLVTLKKWEVWDFSIIAASLGSQTLGFKIITKASSAQILGSLYSIGSSITLGHSAYKAVRLSLKLKQSPKEDKKAIKKEIRNALLDLANASADLAATASPLLFALNPPVITALAIIAKGTGVICIFARS